MRSFDSAAASRRPRSGRTAGRAVAVSAALALACGYGLSARWVGRGGAERVRVRTFENRSTEPELGALVTAAIRTELSRRGADAEADAPAAIEGDVRATEPVPTALRPATGLGGVSTTTVNTWRIGIEVRARLVSGGSAVAEHVARLEAQYLGGGDPLETESRRALALRRLADDAAREVLRAFER